MTEAQKRDAYHEAEHILRLDGKWQQLMPGTRKPNFKRAAREILRRALGRKVRRNDAPLNLHGGLMHEHSEREAHLLERTLKSGHHDPSILHSFQLGSAESRSKVSRGRRAQSTTTTPTCRTLRSTCMTSVPPSTTPATTNPARASTTAVCTRHQSTPKSP